MSKNLLLILTLIITLSACVPTSPKSNRKSSSSSSTGAGATATPPPANTPANFSGPKYWYNNSESISGTITINADIQTVIYLRGSEVHNYLSSYSHYDSVNQKYIYQYDKSFCIVANYEIDTVKKHLRARAVPIDFYNFTTKSKERLLRVDFPKEDDNSSACQGLKFYYDANGATTSNPASVHYIPSTLCPNCNTKVTAESIQFYESTGGFLAPTIVDGAKFTMDGVNVKVDTNSSYSDTGNQCSISSCQAKGFDCCLDGQCVNDGTLRPSATSDPLYSQAIADVTQNSLNFINYPEIFFVCSNMPRPTPTATPTTNPGEVADATFQRELKEYYCLEEGKKDNPDFAVGDCEISPKASETYYQDIKFSFKSNGIIGNGYNVEYEAGGTQGSEVITENSVFKLKIKIQDGVSTANDIITALNNYVNLGNFLQVNYILVGLPSRIQNIGLASPLAGGADPSNQSSLNKIYCEANGGYWKFHCIIGSCSDSAYHSKFDCEANAEIWTAIYTNAENQNGTEQAHNTIRGDVWDRCGCESTPFPTDPDAPQCPDYGLLAIKDASNKITDIICLVPNANAEPTPFQNLSVSVPARSAPHRFFDQDGESHDDLSELKGRTDVSQEGEEFSYTDEGGKTGPVTTEHAINAILGQMTLELNKALPAKMVRVDFDQTYVISATYGYFTPCPTCATDQWFEAFKPFPPSQKGNGLQAIGFITNRSIYGNNLSLGNYEDTAFGRACWVPPTMLPWTHKQYAVLNDQRRHRLKAQSAMYVNGYQRDWFGFNQGALIGSFDGVTWFAIGDGRRITATSNKLFLAINAPFADLAEPTDMTVSVIQDLGQNSVSDFDYDPELSMDHPEQNHGATCRNFHQCNVDSDCVTTLGWEYVCSDILEYRSNWPKFDIEGNEIADKQQANQMWSQLLQGLKLTSNTKRCVYRGAGSPCMRDWSGESKPKQKFLRCAPNFYCADLGRADFNKQLVRTPNLVEVVLFGQDADILGRPVSYLTANSSLSTETQNAINDNAATFKTSGGQIGLCRPGKALSDLNTVNLITKQHINNDVGGRTDYISQISSCNSDAVGIVRTASCPVFDTNPDSDTFGDYIYHEEQFAATTGVVGSDNLSAITYKELSSYQNMCGGESQFMQSGELVSSFKEIEAENLTSLTNLLFPKVALNACLRKAGQVCHTDLDCGPNRLHSDQAQFQDVLNFGNTEAEQKYWQEGLICSQSAYTPQLNTEAFGNYDMTVNRCCREIGQDVSMFTQYSRSNGTLVIEGTDPELVETIFGGNEALRTINTPANSSPSQDGRYSRYSSFKIDDKGAWPLANGPYYQPPLIELNMTGTARAMAPKPYQWKTINDTGRNSCCGNGWVRKFSDGTNDWSNRQRLSIDYTNFTCLNYRSPLPFGRPPGINSNNYQKDVDKLCLSPGEFGCVQYPMDRKENYFALGTSSNAYETYEETTYEIRRPANVVNASGYFPAGPTAGVLETYPINDPSGGTLEQRKSHHTLYQPSPFFTPTEPFDGNWNFMASQTFNYGASFYLPNYIQADNIIRVGIVYFNDGAKVFTGTDDITQLGNCDLTGVAIPYPHTADTKRKCLTAGGVWTNTQCNVISYAAPDFKSITQSQVRANQDPAGVGDGVDEEAFCIKSEGGHDVFHFAGMQNQTTIGIDWQYGGVVIHFNPINTSSFEVCRDTATNKIENITRQSCSGGTLVWGPLSALPDTVEPRVMTPGNLNYYTTKLARLELLGIPQIAYEPVYCNSDRTQVVPGIFDSGLGTRADWALDANTFEYNDSSISGINLGSIYDENGRCSGPACVDGAMSDGAEDRAVLKDKVKIPDIFSENEFKCCRETNLETDSGSNCCSGFASNNGGVLTCKLPPGTDLNVYFNKFVSGEGMSSYIEENTRLVDGDFIPETGEPRMKPDVEQKLVNLAALFCSSGQARAGATDGYFYAEPNNERFYHQTQVDEESTKYRSIIDTNLDFDSDNDTGAFRFNEGFRWSHHIYCN